MKKYLREYYYRQIEGFLRSDMIKVITGIRRCGKSSFLESVMDKLISDGIDSKDIIYLPLDKRGYKNISTPEQLEQAIEERLTDNNFKYLFIDEIQNVKGFETVVNAFREEDNFSIFITGSNSYLLSGELVTKLTGRYVEIEMFPLNFREYIDMKKYLGKPVNNELSEEFLEYLQYGGFPETLKFDKNDDKETYIRNVVTQIIDKDVRQHQHIRNRLVFERIMRYIISNYGATTNISNIVTYLKNTEKISIKPETLFRYLQILERAKIIYCCPRFDVKSKKSLRGEQKYYLADLGIYMAYNPDTRISYGQALENVMFNYLTSRGYKMSVGRIGKLECDFITRTNQDYYYLQISQTIADQHTEEREYSVFRHIRDNYPKYLFTMDTLLQHRDGVKHENIYKFIAEDKKL